MAKDEDNDEEIEETEEDNEENSEADEEYDSDESSGAESNGNGIEIEHLEKTDLNLKDLDENRILGSEISHEMKKAYIDYAMSVIVSRALPAVEDGLKPVHRRILFAMKRMGLDKGMTRKSAKIDDETMGNYHPHGDMAIYDAMVRMAQEFSLRYPLVLGQGNFGCFTADTKVKLTDGRDLSFTELIKENRQGKRNFTFTIGGGEIKISEIKNPRKTRENAEIMKVILDNGEEIKCTLNHKFMLRDGNYKEAKDLESGDSLMPLYPEFINHSKLILCELNKNHKVVGVEFLKEFTDVYDLTIDKTHNFALASGIFVHNSMDGDSPAASRYTEAKLKRLAVELLEDLDKDTVKWVPNFTNELKEPVLLPGKVPNLLINGSSGIAVGMTTNIPPHNLIEVCDAIIKTIEKPNVETEELMEIIKGPDFPTGGQVVAENLKELYETGRAGFIIRGKVSNEDNKGKPVIVITEIPYQTNKAEMVKQIAELVNEKKLPDVSDIRDESSKGKVRVVVELKKGANPQFTTNRLFKSTKLQSRFDAILVALVNGVPKTLNLKEIIKCFIDYRRKIIRKRTEFDLKKAEARLHIVEGLLIALKNLEKVIEIIKKSRGYIDASDALQKKFNLSKKQAEAILEITLKQLTSLEHEKLKKEEKELAELIQELKKILGDESEIFKIIKKELNELKKNYGDPRRSQIIKTVKEIAEKDLVQKMDVVITITEKGYIKRMPFKSYHEQKRGGKGMIGAELSSEDFVKTLISCSTHDYLLLFTERGRLFWLKAYKVPEIQRYGKGQAIVNLLNIKDDRITNVIPVKEFKEYLFMATKKGQVKKIKMDLFSKPRNTGVRIINLPLDGSDSVIDVKEVKDKQEVMLISKKGQAIRFNSDDVRNMGRASYGVCGIKLEDKDEVVSLEIVEDVKDSILTITEKGYGKRSTIEDYRKTGRAGKGVINLRVNEKTGNVIDTINVKGNDKFVVSTQKGIVIKTSVRDIRVMGRATSGVRIIKIGAGDRVSAIAKLTMDDEIEEDEEGE